MEVLLLGIYSFFVWLIFIKFKLLPWTTPWKVAVAIIPVVGLMTLMLLLNVVAPTTDDVRVIKYIVPVVSQVRGRVIEVPVENNRPVKKGDVLFRIDPTPYQNAVQSLEARLVSDKAKLNAERSKVNEVEAKLVDSVSGGKQLREELNVARAQVAALLPTLALAQKRVDQNRQLAAAGAGNRFDLEQAETNVNEITAQIVSARATEQQVQSKLDGLVNGELATVAATRAQVATARAQVAVAEAQIANTEADLATSRWELSQTAVFAPSNGSVVNLQLRVGTFVAGMPFNEVMTFVENDYQIYAFFLQNELHQVQPGDEAELSFQTWPGRIIKAHVDSILWAQGQGQMDASGNLPNTTITVPPGRFPVKLVVGEKDRDIFLAAGARGDGAIYTKSLAPVHILRKVILRIGAKLNYLVVKHLSSLGHG
jgi:multidrug resistance efflux pump